jgi:hypothetical protein
MHSILPSRSNYLYNTPPEKSGFRINVSVFCDSQVYEKTLSFSEEGLQYLPGRN